MPNVEMRYTVICEIVFPCALTQNEGRFGTTRANRVLPFHPYCIARPGLVLGRPHSARTSAAKRAASAVKPEMCGLTPGHPARHRCVGGRVGPLRRARSIYSHVAKPWPGNRKSERRSGQCANHGAREQAAASAPARPVRSARPAASGATGAILSTANHGARDLSRAVRGT
jgi:hypothetical protein